MLPLLHNVAKVHFYWKSCDKAGFLYMFTLDKVYIITGVAKCLYLLPTWFLVGGRWWQHTKITRAQRVVLRCPCTAERSMNNLEFSCCSCCCCWCCCCNSKFDGAFWDRGFRVAARCIRRNLIAFHIIQHVFIADSSGSCYRFWAGRFCSGCTG